MRLRAQIEKLGKERLIRVSVAALPNTPMNPLAEIETVKSLGQDDPMAMFERVMDEMQRVSRDLAR